MKDLGIQQSTVKPESVEVLESLVFVNTNIQPVTERQPSMFDGEEQVFEGFNFHVYQYTKDEYIAYLQDRTKTLEQTTTDLEVALCDVYEMIAG